METVRAFFSKTGRLKYIGHLDLMRTLSRVFNRCGLPIWHTQGFNPRPYLTFALPLSLGFDSSVESFDFRLTEPVGFETIKDRLNAKLPPDLRILRVAEPVRKPGDIAFADYAMTFIDREAGRIGEVLRGFLARDTIPAVKMTKKGESTVDLKEHLTVLGLETEEGSCRLEVRLPAGSTFNLSPLLLTDAFIKEFGREPYWLRMERTAIRTEDFSDFA